MALQETGVSLIAENKARFLADMDSASKAVMGFGDVAGKAAGGLGKIGETSIKIGADLAKVGLAAGAAAAAVTSAFAVKAVSAFGDFEAAILKTKSVLDKDEWTEENKKKIEDLALKLGADLPISATDAANGFSELAKASFTANEILQAGSGLANLAVAGQLDMSRSAEILAASLRGFQLPASQANHVADLLAKTANASAISVDDMGETFKYIAPVAKAAGFSIEEMSVAIGVMGNAGIKASQAGTSLRSIITRLAAPPKAAWEALQALGIKTSDASGKMKSFTDILTELRFKFKDLSQEQALQFAAQIAGKEAMSGFLSVVQAAPEDLAKMTDAIATADGQAARTAKTMSEGLNGSIENLKGSIETFMIKAGGPLGGVIEDIARKAADLVNKFTPLGETLGTKLADGVKSVVTALEKIDWEGLIKKATPIVTTIMDIAGALNPLAIGIELLAGVLTGNIDKALSDIGNRFARVVEITAPFVPKLIAIAGDLITKLLEWVAKNGPAIGTELLKWGVQLVEWVAPQIPKILDAIGKVVASMVDWFIKDGLPVISKTLTEWGNALWQWIEKSWPDWLKTASEWFTKVTTWLGDQVPPLIEKLGEWGKALVDWVMKEFPNWLKEAIKFSNKILDWVGEQTPGIGKKLGEWANAFVNWLTQDVMPKIPGLLADIITTLSKAAADAIPKLVKIGTDIGGNLWGAILRTTPAGFLIGSAVGGDNDATKKKKLEEEYTQKIGSYERAYKQGLISRQQYELELTEASASYNKALGTPGYAKGTLNAPGGWSLVGEAGPELAYLPYGSQVMPHAMTAAQIGQMGNNYNYNYNYNSGGNTTYNNSMQAGSQSSAMGFDQFHLMSKRGR